MGGNAQASRAGIGGLPLGDPLWVLVTDANNQPVTNSTVTFAGPTGMDLSPNPVTTNSTGFARTWARLPDIPNTKFTVKASASTGGSATFQVSTGPHVVSSFGDASTACGVVAGDGTYYSGYGSIPIGSAAIFNTDGTLRSTLRPSLGPGKALVENGAPLLMTVDQKIYHQGDPVVVTDNSFNLVRILDFTGRIAPMDQVGGYFAADTDGFIYLVSPDIAAIYDTSLARQQDLIFPATLYGATPRAVGTANGHLVVMGGPASAGAGFQLSEYDRTGKVLHSQPLPAVLGTGATVKVNAAGNYFVYDGETVVSVFDSNLNPVGTIPVPYRPDQFAGADSAGNLYFCGGEGTTVMTNSGALSYSLGSGGLNATPPAYPNRYVGAFNGPIDGAADPLTNTFYYYDHSQVQKFSGGVFQASFSAPATDPQDPRGMAFLAPGTLYLNSLNSIQVRDASSGTLLNTITDSRFAGLKAIAIDGAQNKYVLDAVNLQIHVLDPSDQYVRAIPLNLPSGFASQQVSARLAATSDDSLVFCIYVRGVSPDAGFLKKISVADGTELWSKSFSSTSFDPVVEIALDATGRIYALRSVLEVYDASGNILTTSPFLSDGTLPRPAAPMATVGNTVYVYVGGTVYGLSMD